MEFKIDTKDSFSIIMPLTARVDAKMADEIARQCENLRQNGSNNYIIDMQNATEADAAAMQSLVALHEQIYGNEESIVFTGINPGFWAALKETETDLLLNIAPKMIE